MKKKTKKRKSKKFGFKDGLIIGFCLTIAILCTILAVYTYLDNKVSVNPSLDKAGSIAENCQNMDIFESGECVNAHVRAIYKYNISNVGKALSYENLIKYGGVCENFARLYCQIGDELGFYTKYVNGINTGWKNLTIGNETKNYKTSHAFCIWSNSQGWVGLDQKTIFKFEFAGGQR